MISQLHLKGPRPNIANAEQAHKLLVMGNWGMIFGVLMMVVSVIISFPFAAGVSLSIQIVAHIGTLIFAAVVKIGYILRSIALNRFAGFNAE